METLGRRCAPILGVYVLCAFVLAAVAGCGGGGSADSAAAQNVAPPPAPAAAPPTIGGTPTGQVTAGQAYSFTPTTTDPSGGMLTFSIQNMPSWATFSTATGVLSGTPASANVGTFANIAISVSDGKTSAALAPFSITVAAAPVVTGSANLTWVAPTTNTDGTPLTDLGGFTINYGSSPSALTQTINVANAMATTYTVQGLAAGTWYFTVTAYTSVGTQSAPSDVASKTIS
jgi:Putative Ig domain